MMSMEISEISQKSVCVDETMSKNIVAKFEFPMKRRLRTSNEFFREGNIECNLVRRDIDCTKEEIEQLFDYTTPHFQCNIHGCKESFNDISIYEAHYNIRHCNVCSTCNRLLPSPHLLELHIEEMHSSIFSEKCLRESMYRCFEESCSEKFADHCSRKQHLLQDHDYPASYRFNKVLKNRVVPRRQEAKQKSETGEEKTSPVGAGNRVFSYKIPEKIQFGHGKNKCFGKRVVEFKGNTNAMDMSDVRDALVNSL